MLIFRKSSMNDQYANQNARLETMFAQALHLAQHGQRQLAYHLFKQLSNTPFSANNPIIWLWLANLTDDFKEGETALQKLAQLDPSHRDLAPAKLDLVRRKQNALLKRRIALVGLSVSLAWAAFFTTQIAEVFPNVGDLSGIYTRQYMSKYTAVLGSWLAISCCLVFVIYATSRLFRQQKQTLLILLSAGSLLLLNLITIFSHIGRAEEYHNQVQINGSVYHLESVRLNRGGGIVNPTVLFESLNATRPAYYVALILLPSTASSLTLTVITSRILKMTLH
jgi:hypothetical protein